MANGSEMNTMARASSSTKMEAIILDDSSEDRPMALERSDWQMEPFAVDCGSAGSSCKNAQRRNVKNWSPRVHHAPNWVENKKVAAQAGEQSARSRAEDYVEYIGCEMRKRPLFDS